MTFQTLSQHSMDIVPFAALFHERFFALEAGKEGILLNIINDYVVPSARSVSSIPSDPEAGARVESFIQMAAGSKQPVPALADIALNISGKTYKLEQNFLGWLDMTYHFEPGSDEARLIMSDSPDLEIGLDNRYRLTETSNSKPIGLRGHWIESDIFYLDYIISGDFIRSEARIKFEGNEITVTIHYLNWNSPSIVLHGSVQE